MSLIFCCILETFCSNKKLIFYSNFGIMTLALCFRYGQGTDYFGYMLNYYLIDNHSEIGYKLLTGFLNSRNIPFELFIFCISIFTMICTFRAISLYSPGRMLSLLVLYPTIYLTYYFSGLRQGVVIAFFLGFMIKWVYEGKFIHYITACLILAGIHSAALILIPLVLLKRVSIRQLYLGILLSVMLGGIMLIAPQEILNFVNIGAFQVYMKGINISFMGLLERIVMFILVSVLVQGIPEDSVHYDFIIFLYKIYLFGLIIVFIFVTKSLISSRLSAFMKSVEVLLIPLLVQVNRKWKQVIPAVMCFYALVMTTKNLESYVSQGKYEGYNAFTYPYISIFNKKTAEARDNYSKIISQLQDHK